MKGTVTRLALALGAVVVAAWFALGWVQARDIGRAQAIAGGRKLTVGQVQRAQSLLSAAATLNPDRTVDMARAQLASDRGDYGLAISILEPVTRAEPMNLEAWIQLSIAAERSRRTQVATLAFGRIHELLREPK